MFKKINFQTYDYIDNPIFKPKVIHEKRVIVVKKRFALDGILVLIELKNELSFMKIDF